MNRFHIGMGCVCSGMGLLFIASNWSIGPHLFGFAYTGSLLLSVIGVGMLVSLLRISWR